MITLERGMIILWWSGSAFGKLQKFFTKRGARWYDSNPASGERSHTSVLYGQDSGGNWRDIDISTTAKLSPFDINTGSKIWIYKLKNVPDYLISQAVETVWETYKNKKYGFLQLLYFPRRWFWEKIINNKYANLLCFGWLITKLHGGKDIRRWGNWFPQNGICSEGSVQDYLRFICAAMPVQEYDSLLKRLDEWDKNNFHAWDAKIVCDGSPEVFEVVYNN
jgi:hypothetical protein